MSSKKIETTSEGHSCMNNIANGYSEEASMDVKFGHKGDYCIASVGNKTNMTAEEIRAFSSTNRYSNPVPLNGQFYTPHNDLPETRRHTSVYTQTLYQHRTDAVGSYRPPALSYPATSSNSRSGMEGVQRRLVDERATRAQSEDSIGRSQDTVGSRRAGSVG